MKKQTRPILFVLIAFLIVLTTAIPNNWVAGQSDPPVNYIPFFAEHRNPDYAYGLDGGTVENVIVDPNDSNIVYAGTWGNGIYKSLDGGASWEIHITDELQSAFIYEIAIDPLNSDHLLASVYEHGIDQSFDGGITWEPTAGFEGYYVAYSIDFDSSVALSDPVRSSTVYAAIRQQTVGSTYPGGVWKSIDGGDSWAQKTFYVNGFLDEDYIYDLAIDPRNPNIIYTANHRTGIYKTTNGGNNWTKVSRGLVHEDVRGIQVNPITGRIYAGLWDGYGFAYSDNGGASWINNGPTDYEDLYVYEIQYDPHQPEDVYLTTSTGIYLCESPSASSMCKVMTSGDKFVFDLALDLNGPIGSNNRVANMYTGLQNFGLLKSDDGGVDFQPSYRGIRVNIVREITVNTLDPNLQFVSAANRGLYRSTDGGQTWESLHYALNMEFIREVIYKPDSIDTLFVGDSAKGIYYSLDNGNFWIPSNSGLDRSIGEDLTVTISNSSDGSIDASDYDWMDPVDLQDLMDATNFGLVDREVEVNVKTIGFDPDNSDYMFAGKGSGGVVYSNDGGASWSKSNLTWGTILDSMVDPNQPNKFIVGLMDNGVKVSSDRVIWPSLNEGFPSGVDVYALALQGPGVYLAGTYDGLFRLDLNVTTTWVNLGLDEDIRDIAIDPVYPEMIWAATDDGLFYGTPITPEGPYEWHEFDVPNSNNTLFKVIEVIPGVTREFYVGMNGGDIVRLTEDILPIP